MAGARWRRPRESGAGHGGEGPGSGAGAGHGGEALGSEAGAGHGGEARGRGLELDTVEKARGRELGWRWECSHRGFVGHRVGERLDSRKT